MRPFGIFDAQKRSLKKKRSADATKSADSRLLDRQDMDRQDMDTHSKVGIRIKSNAGSMGAVADESDIQEDSESTTSKPKKKDNTLLIVGVAAFALMVLKGR